MEAGMGVSSREINSWVKVAQFFLRGLFQSALELHVRSRPTLCMHPHELQPAGCSVRGAFQAGVLEWASSFPLSSCTVIQCCLVKQVIQILVQVQFLPLPPSREVVRLPRGTAGKEASPGERSCPACLCSGLGPHRRRWLVPGLALRAERSVTIHSGDSNQSPHRLSATVQSRKISGDSQGHHWLDHHLLPGWGLPSPCGEIILRAFLYILEHEMGRSGASGHFQSVCELTCLSAAELLSPSEQSSRRPSC